MSVSSPYQASLDLPRRPTKLTDIRAKGFGDISVESDAIAPDDLRPLAERVIERHLLSHLFMVLKAAEESERVILGELVASLRRRV